MRVLIADEFPPKGRAELERLGLAITYEPKAGAEGIARLLADHTVLVVRGTKVSGEALNAGKALQLVVRAGAGVNTIDVKTASRLGIFVANCPGKNAIAVAELAMGLLLSLDRRIPQANAELHAGQWNKKEYSQADGLFGKTLGIVGMGGIGCEVATRAHALGMHVVAWSRGLTEQRAKTLGVERMPDLPTLAQRSQAVSLHLAYTKETKGLISRAFLAHLPVGALLVNTSRDGVVDEVAVIDAMQHHHLRYATDVFDGEPSEAVAETQSPIARHPDVICTPHIGASTEQAQAAVADETVRIVSSFVKTGAVPNCVNLCAQSKAEWQLNVRHQNRVGVLAGVLGAVREAGINVEEVENIIFDGAEAACARIRLSTEVQPDAALIASIGHIQHVTGVQLVTL